MNGKNIELTRRRVLFAVAIVGLASAAAGAGTMAYFSDSNASTNNTVSAGTLIVSMDSGDSALFNAGPIAPGRSNSSSTTVTNAGSLDGYVDVQINNVSGGLSDDLNVTASLDDDGNVTTTGDQTVVANGTLDSVATEYETNASLESGDSTNLVVEWSLDSDVGDGAQGEQATFDLKVMLDQTKGQ